MSAVANSNWDSSETAAGAARSADTPLFSEMRDSFSQLADERLRQVLNDSLDAEASSLRAVERSFAGFLAGCQTADVRRRFFASWQRTNNSALSVEGLANRMSAEGEAQVAGSEPDRALPLFRAAGRLNRVADEDLGVGGQTLHFELFYRMASELSGGDDQWQSRQFCLPVALEFKAWLEATRLRAPILAGLYSLLVHEGYTHAELETISAPFHEWATGRMGLSQRAASRILAWIRVHTGGTEKAHFAHTCASLAHYLEGSGATVDLQVAGETFRTYFRLKGAVMAQLSAMYD